MPEHPECTRSHPFAATALRGSAITLAICSGAEAYADTWNGCFEGASQETSPTMSSSNLADAL